MAILVEDSDITMGPATEAIADCFLDIWVRIEGN